MNLMTAMQKLAPVLIVEEIEACLPFWMERLKFAKTVEVPHGPQLGFAILQRGGVEIMLQTRASVAEDIPELVAVPISASSVALFIEVDSLDEIITALDGADVFMPVRTTFYGMREIGVRAPGGCPVTFAQKVAAA